MENALVLVADDSPTLVKIVSQVLEGAGYRVATAEDGVECVQKFYASPPDLLILDLSMPKLSGYLVSRLIKEDWSASHVPIIILTARDAATDRFWSAKSGAERFLTKDFGPDDLLQAVDQLLAERQPSFMAPVSAPQHLSEGSVLSRVCELLDRNLFESTLVNEISELGANLRDFPDAADSALSILSNFLSYSLGGIALGEERVFAIRPIGAVSSDNVASIVHQMEEALAHGRPEGEPLEPPTVITLDRAGQVVDADMGALQTFVSMPMRSGGTIVGVLGLASNKPNAFDESELATLRIIEHPLASVIDNARLYERVASTPVYGSG